MDKDEAFIRECAARQYSKSRTAQLLGLWPQKFNEILKILPLPIIEWADPHYSAAAVVQRQDLHNVLRSRKQILTSDQRLVLAEKCRDRAPKYSAFGVTGTLPELVKRFGVVSIHSVVNRMKVIGMSLEEALTKPRFDHTSRENRNNEKHPWRLAENSSFTEYKERQQASNA